MNKPHSEKNKLFTKENIIMLIIGSILAFFVSKLFDPLFSFLFSSILNIGGGIMGYISDSTYQQISNGFSEQTSAFMMYIIYLFSWFILSYGFSSFTNNYKDHLRICDNNADALKLLNIDSENNMDSSTISSPHKSKEELAAEAQNLLASITSNRKKYKILYYMTVVIFIFAFIVLLFTYSKNSFVHLKVTKLTNNIEIVSPYISDLEYKQLKSNFYSMKNSNDYYDLVSALTTISTEYSIELKE